MDIANDLASGDESQPAASWRSASSQDLIATLLRPSTSSEHRQPTAAPPQTQRAATPARRAASVLKPLDTLSRRELEQLGKTLRAQLLSGSDANGAAGWVRRVPDKKATPAPWERTSAKRTMQPLGGQHLDSCLHFPHPGPAGPRREHNLFVSRGAWDNLDHGCLVHGEVPNGRMPPPMGKTTRMRQRVSGVSSEPRLASKNRALW